MNSIIIGLGLLFLGMVFSSLPAVLFGALAVMAGLYVGKSRSVKEQKQPTKTKHRVLMSEPPEEPIEWWLSAGEFPAKGNFDKRGFLPLPDYGYTDPLERIFFQLPVSLVKKK
jgi:hypothetical protein